MLPPLSTLVVWTIAGGISAVAAHVWLDPGVSFRIWIANLAFIVLYVLRGWSLSETGARGLLELACAPFYVVWKIWLRLRQRDQPKDWVRTAREAPAGTAREASAETAPGPP